MNAICLFIKIRAFLCNHLFVNVELFCQIQRIKYTPLVSNFHCSPSKLQSQPSSSSKSRSIPPSESTLSTSTIDPSSTVTPRPKSKQSGGLFLPPVQKLVATLRCTYDTSTTSPVSRTFNLQAVGAPFNFQTHPVRM